jgi:hypothetical protein
VSSSDRSILPWRPRRRCYDLGEGEPVTEPDGDTAGTRASVDARLARVERWLDLGVLAAGVVLFAVAPGSAIHLGRPTLLVAAGVALLGAGLIRDLAWLRLAGRPAPARPAGPREARLCLESSLGVLAIAGGLAWRALWPGAPIAVAPGTLVVGLGLVGTFGHLTRHVIVALRIEPGHQNVRFWR